MNNMAFPNCLYVNVVHLRRRMCCIKDFLTVLSLISPYVDIHTRLQSMYELYHVSHYQYIAIEKLIGWYQKRVLLESNVSSGKYKVVTIGDTFPLAVSKCPVCGVAFDKFHACDGGTFVNIRDTVVVRFQGVWMKCTEVNPFNGDVWNVVCYEHRMFSHVIDLYYKDGDGIFGTVCLSEECMMADRSAKGRRINVYLRENKRKRTNKEYGA